MMMDFTKVLLEWDLFCNERSMPWKGEKDPYRIWISEIILQQTRVEQGWTYYEKFINAFPNIASLAAAEDDTVFKLWEGLGYYSRCRNLLAAARYVVNELRGEFPRSYSELLQLKGVGEYTASAIASFAYNEPKAVVDGNVTRLLSRYFGIHLPIDSLQGKREFAALAQTLIAINEAARYNQAIMDFGASICRPRKPECEKCPFMTGCKAYNTGTVSLLPVKSKTISKRTRWMNYFLVRENNHVFIRKRNSADIWQDLFEFVLHESSSDIGERPETLMEELTGAKSFTISHFFKSPAQQLSHQEIRGNFYVVDAEAPQALYSSYSAIPVNNLHAYAFPRFINTFLNEYRF